MIVGSSVHNQRVERFWRDMHRCVTILYYLEYHEPTNEVHLFDLPRINQGLKTFSSGWNSHSLRTEHVNSYLQQECFSCND